MPVQVLRARVDDGIGAQIHRPLEVRCGERVVHDQPRTVIVRDLRSRREIRDMHQRVGRRLHQNQPCVLADSVLDPVGLTRVHEGELEPQPGEDLAEEAVRPAIDVGAADHVIAARQKLDHRLDRGQARCERRPVLGPLQRGHVRLQGRSGRIRYPSILVPLMDADPFLGEGGCLVDRRHDRPGRRIGPLPGVDRPGGETLLLLRHITPRDPRLRGRTHLQGFSDPQVYVAAAASSSGGGRGGVDWPSAVY